MTDKISRRDFLKLSGLGLGAVALRKPVEKIDKLNLTLEQEKSFETDSAVYYPFFESHTTGVNAQRVISVKPDFFFTELMIITDHLKDYTPQDILYSTAVVPGNPIINSEEIPVGRVVSDELLIYLSKNNGNFVLEGMGISPKLDKSSDIINMTSAGLGLSAGLTALGIGLKRLASEGSFSKSDRDRIFASLLAELWASSDELSRIPVVTAYETEKDSTMVRNFQHVANRVSAAVSLAHPEDVIVFMRNIFMSLKLITIAENAGDQTKKPKIAFRAGAAHGAISDFIKMGRIITTHMLDIYPDSILLDVISYNTPNEENLTDKIDSFCKTVVVSVGDALKSNTGKTYYSDIELKKYLLNRFDMEGNVGPRVKQP